MDDFLNVLALNKDQYEWMLSLEAAKVTADIREEKDSKKAQAKNTWLEEWLKLQRTAFEEQYGVPCTIRTTALELCQRSAELASESMGLTWYYLSVMEAELFIPYTPLYGDDKEKNKQFKNLNLHKSQYVKNLVEMDDRIDASFVDRVKKAYKAAVERMDGKFTKLTIAVLATVAVAAVTAATAGLFAGPIAVALVGGQFTFSGAALTSASLAALAGGSLAVGGGGMAGGVAIIVGGGALMGLAVGGTASTVTSIVLSSPEMTLTAAAKLEVTIKEVLLNAQKDVEAAQKILASYKSELKQLKHALVDLEEENAKNKEQIKAMKKSIGYLKKSIESLEKFSSAYQVGHTVELAERD